MPTEFRFEHSFEAASPADILAAYFDDGHLAAQDAVAGMRDRSVVESRDDGAVWTCAWKVASTRALPSIVKPFVGVTWALRRGAEWYLRVDNLTNVQRNERDNLQITQGRTTTFGLRLSR
jgi:hypothetical protein